MTIRRRANRLLWLSRTIPVVAGILIILLVEPVSRGLAIGLGMAATAVGEAGAYLVSKRRWR